MSKKRGILSGFFLAGFRFAKSKLYVVGSLAYFIYHYTTHYAAFPQYVFYWLIVTMIIVMLPFNMISPPAKDLGKGNKH